MEKLQVLYKERRGAYFTTPYRYHTTEEFYDDYKGEEFISWLPLGKEPNVPKYQILYKNKDDYYGVSLDRYSNWEEYLSFFPDHEGVVFFVKLLILEEEEEWRQEIIKRGNNEN